MNARYTALALTLLASLASCSSSAGSGHAATTPSSTAAVTRATAPPAGTPVQWRGNTNPGKLYKECNSPQDCVLLATETGTFDGDLQGTDFSGGSSAFATSGHFVVGRTDLFRGTVTGCGSGTLVFVGTELADTHRGSGEWRIVAGFGTGDLAHATGHGTGDGVVDAAGFHSRYRGVIDCGT